MRSGNGQLYNLAQKRIVTCITIRANLHRKRIAILFGKTLRLRRYRQQHTNGQNNH